MSRICIHLCQKLCVFLCSSFLTMLKLFERYIVMYDFQAFGHVAFKHSTCYSACSVCKKFKVIDIYVNKRQVRQTKILPDFVCIIWNKQNIWKASIQIILWTAILLGKIVYPMNKTFQADSMGMIKLNCVTHKNMPNIKWILKNFYNSEICQRYIFEIILMVFLTGTCASSLTSPLYTSWNQSIVHKNEKFNIIVFSSFISRADHFPIYWWWCFHIGTYDIYRLSASWSNTRSLNIVCNIHFNAVHSP